MEHLRNRIERIKREHHGRVLRGAFVGMLSFAMLFLTVGLLLLPAYTEKKHTFCGLEEHVHTDACYKKRLVCGLQEKTQKKQTKEDELEEDAGHIHTEACYEDVLACELQEHTHTLACYADPTADLETAANWEAGIPGHLPNETLSEYLVRVARSQLGYKESERNYSVAEDGEVHGYSRYGAFAGKPYEPWSGAFASFCMHYAGIGADVFPCDADAGICQRKLTERGLYADHATSPYRAFAGDLVFFRADDGELLVGIVFEANADSGDLRAVAGDFYGKVEEVAIEFTEARLVGFGCLPESLRPEEDLANADEEPSGSEPINIEETHASEPGEAADGNGESINNKKNEVKKSEKNGKADGEGKESVEGEEGKEREEEKERKKGEGGEEGEGGKEGEGGEKGKENEESQGTEEGNNNGGKNSIGAKGDEASVKQSEDGAEGDSENSKDTSNTYKGTEDFEGEAGKTSDKEEYKGDKEGKKVREGKEASEDYEKKEDSKDKEGKEGKEGKEDSKDNEGKEDKEDLENNEGNEESVDNEGKIDSEDNEGKIDSEDNEGKIDSEDNEGKIDSEDNEGKEASADKEGKEDRKNDKREDESDEENEDGEEDKAPLARAMSYSFQFNVSDPAAGYAYVNSRSYGESVTLAVMNDGLSAGTVRPRSSGAPTNGRLSASNGYEFRFWRIDGYYDFGRGDENPSSYSDRYAIRPKVGDSVGDSYVTGNAHTFTACFAPEGEHFITFDRYIGADPYDGRVYGYTIQGGAKSYEYIDEYGNTQTVYFCYSDSARGMHASATDDGVFIGWYQAGTDICICETPDFVPPDGLDRDLTVQAHFRKATAKTVTYASYNSRVPSVAGGKIRIHNQWWEDYTVYESVMEGRTPAGATALSYGNYTFIGWRDENNVLLTRDADLYPEGPLFADRTYRAEYLETKYSRVLLRVNTRGYGRLMAGDEDWTDTLQGYNRNSSGNLRLPKGVQAVPSEGFRFDHWELNGRRFSNDTWLTVRDLGTAPDDWTNVQELIAIFQPICKVSYDLGVLQQVGINDASYQHWEDVPWCPKEVGIVKDGLTAVGEDFYEETVDYGSALTLPELTKETRVSQTNNGYNLLTHSFKGWRIEGDATGTIYLPGQTVNIYTQTKLIAVWDAYFDGKVGYYGAGDPGSYRYNTNTCGFFVRLFDSEFDIGNVGTYTDCLFTTRLIGAPLYSGNGRRDDFSGDSVASVRSDIDQHDAYLRANAATSIMANADSAFAGAGMRLELPFPSDEFIFGRIRKWNAAQSEEHKIQINGHVIPQEQLTTDYYDLRWYVLKDQENSWHIDGMLLPKYAKLVVTKSFVGDPEAIGQVKSKNFYIGVDEKKENTDGDGREEYRLNLQPWSYDNPDGYRYIDWRGQYVWVLDELLPMKSYWVAEHRYEASQPFSTAASYLIFNTAQAATSGSTRAEVKQVYSYADEVWVDGIQTVAFTNRYTKPREISLVKLDKTTQNPLSNVPFHLVLYADQGDGQVIELPMDTRTDENGRITAVFTEELDWNGQHVRILSYQPGGFDGRHRFLIAEGANEGYTGLSEPITGYVTFYDDREAVLTLDDPNNPLVRVATEGDGGAVLYVTNAPETCQVRVRKTWPNGGDRPVNMQLLRNGIAWLGRNVTLGADASLVAEDPEHNTAGWSHVWRDLPAYVDGEKVVYTVREEWIGVPGGTDSIHYNTASDADGYADYIVNQSQAMDSDGNVEVYVENTPDGGQVVFSKVDDQEKAVPGAEFTVYKDADARLPVSAADFREGTDKARPAVFVSDENGMVTLAGLKGGTYYLRETKAPAGYVLGDSRIFTLTIRAANSALTDPETGKAVTKFENPVYSAAVSICKVESGGRTPLQGAVFSLHASRADGSMNPAPMRGYEQKETGADGRVSIGKLRRGIYYLVEETAPPGYDKLDEPIRLTVPDSAETSIFAIRTESNTALPVSADGIVTVENSKGITLPTTGSHEEGQMAHLANILLAAASVLWTLWVLRILWMRRAKKRGGGEG